MHSSRMRTDCCSGHYVRTGGCLPGGCVYFGGRGVCLLPGILPTRRCLPNGVCLPYTPWDGPQPARMENGTDHTPFGMEHTLHWTDHGTDHIPRDGSHPQDGPLDGLPRPRDGPWDQRQDVTSNAPPPP